MNKKTKIICAVVGMILLVGVMAGCYLHFGPSARTGEKQIIIEVIDNKGDAKRYELTTDAEYLLGAMEAAKEKGLTFHGEEGDMGMTIDTVNGLKADFNEGSEYWAFYVNGEYCNYGPEKQPVADHDEFKIEYSVWKK